MLLWTLRASAAFFVADAAANAQPEATSTAATVTIKDGRLQGIERSGVREFLGVPYGEPPVKKLRWLPPRPRKPWAPATRKATSVSPGCLRDGDWWTLNSATSEDCLYLNVWAPPAKHVVHRKVPVMVWIYGGGFHTGAGDDLQTRGDAIVRAHGDVVVVTFNYRLCALGFLGSEELRRYTYERTGQNTTGNMGFLDQVLVLKWVQANIAAFGGNPDSVLLFGESSGAGAVSVHLVSPLSRGLFHRAVLQSGGFTAWSATSLRQSADNFRALVKAMRRLPKDYDTDWARKYQCRKNSSDLQCLVKSDIPGEHLIEIAGDSAYEYMKNSYDWDGMLNVQWGPTVDGVVLPEHPVVHLGHHKWNPVPVIVGINKDDGTEFMDGCRDGEDADGRPTCPLDSHLYDSLYDYFFDGGKINNRRCFRDPLYKKWLGANWGAKNVAELHKHYHSLLGTEGAEGGYSTNYWAAEHLVADFMLFCFHMRAAKLMLSHAPVFQYYFTRTPSQAPFGQPPHEPVCGGFGACHGCEIPFIFEREGEIGVDGPGEFALSRAMSTYWTNFAWSGDPNNGTGRATATSSSEWSASPNNRTDSKNNTFLPRWSAGPNNRTDSKKNTFLPLWPSHTESGGVLQFGATDHEAEIQPMQAHPRGTVCADFWHGYLEKEGWMPKWVSRPRRRRRLEEESSGEAVCGKAEGPFLV